VRRGHAVTLFASGDSRTKAELAPVVPEALRPAGVPDVNGPHLVELGLLRERLADFDVIHSHVDYYALPFGRPGDPPIVHTMHGRLDLPEQRPVYSAFPFEPLVSISDAQRRALPQLRWLATVHHGLPLADYPVGEGRGRFVLFLGRMSAEKRPHVAIDVARRAGVRLVLAAKVDDANRPYFEREVQPRLGQPGIDYVGETGPEDTLRLLGEARALLFPIDWPEPFGLVMIESMATGTPVITCRRGSAPEVVADGVTGFVCDDDAALVRALGRIDELDRAACRSWVGERFSVGRMTDDYENVYRRLRREGVSLRTTSSAFTTGTTSSRLPGSPTTVPGS
jgi:glycosyltransferase involved in cell wall biosynthesis